MRWFFALSAGLVLSPAALSQATYPLLFVGNNVSGGVTVFRTSPTGDLTRIGNFPAGTNPQDLGVTRRGRNLVVVNATQATVEELYTFVVNPDGTLTRLHPPSLVGDGPLALNVTAGDLALVPSASERTLTSFRIENDRTVFASQVGAGQFPTHLASNAPGTLAWLCGTAGSAYIRSYRLLSGGIIELTSELPGLPGTGQGLALHPAGDVLYFSNGLGNAVSWFAIDPLGALSFRGSASNGGNSCVELAVHPTGAYLYVCNVVSDTLTVMPVAEDGSLSDAVASYSIGNDIRDVVTDGRFVYVTDESTLGGSPMGVVVFRVNVDGSLTRLATHDTAGARPQRMSLWDPRPKIYAHRAVLERGRALGGGRMDLAFSDDVHWAAAPGLVLTREEPPIRLRLRGTSPVADPAGLLVSYEASVTASPPSSIEERVEVFDVSLGRFVPVGSFVAEPGDAIRTVRLTGDLTRFVNPADHGVQARISFVPVGPLASPNWSARIDEAGWIVEL